MENGKIENEMKNIRFWKNATTLIKKNDGRERKWMQNSIFQPTFKMNFFFFLENENLIHLWHTTNQTPLSLQLTLPTIIHLFLFQKSFPANAKYGWSKKISKENKLTPGNWLAIKRCINDVFPTRTSPTKTIFIECWCW